MTLEQIDRAVEKKTDRLDRAFMADDSEITQAEYDAQIKAIDAWADAERSKNPP